AGAADAESRRIRSLLPPRGRAWAADPESRRIRSLPRQRGRAGVGAAGADQMTLLSTLHRSGHLRTLDHALAESLRRLDPDTPDAVLAAAALASLAVAAGHAGFDPAQPHQLVDVPIDWPSPETWRQALASSHWVARPDAGDAESPAEAPLVLEHGLLYLRRYREYERRLAAGLRRIGKNSAPPHLFPRLRGKMPEGQMGARPPLSPRRSRERGPPRPPGLRRIAKTRPPPHLSPRRGGKMPEGQGGARPRLLPATKPPRSPPPWPTSSPSSSPRPRPAATSRP